MNTEHQSLIDDLRREAEDWLRRNVEGASMEDPSPLIRALIDAKIPVRRDLDLIREMLDLPTNELRAAVTYLDARLRAE